MKWIIIPTTQIKDDLSSSFALWLDGLENASVQPSKNPKQIQNCLRQNTWGLIKASMDTVPMNTNSSLCWQEEHRLLQRRTVQSEYLYKLLDQNQVASSLRLVKVHGSTSNSVSSKAQWSRWLRKRWRTPCRFKTKWLMHRIHKNQLQLPASREGTCSLHWALAWDESVPLKMRYGMVVGVNKINAEWAPKDFAKLSTWWYKGAELFYSIHQFGLTFLETQLFLSAQNEDFWGCSNNSVCSRCEMTLLQELRNQLEDLHWTSKRSTTMIGTVSLVFPCLCPQIALPFYDDWHNGKSQGGS